MPKFVLKDMEGLYIEEMNTAINTLKVMVMVGEVGIDLTGWYNDQM